MKARCFHSIHDLRPDHSAMMADFRTSGFSFRTVPGLEKRPLLYTYIAYIAKAFEIYITLLVLKSYSFIIVTIHSRSLNLLVLN